MGSLPMAKSLVQLLHILKYGCHTLKFFIIDLFFGLTARCKNMPGCYCDIKLAGCVFLKVPYIEMCGSALRRFSLWLFWFIKIWIDEFDNIKKQFAAK